MWERLQSQLRSSYSSGFIQRRKPILAMDVGKASVRAQSFILIKEYILERNLITVNSVVRGSVNVHIFSAIRRVHTGEKPNKCDDCGKDFSHRSNLHNHQRVHIREKPYQCSICNRGFTYSSAVQIHQRVHSGEKPH